MNYIQRNQATTILPIVREQMFDYLKVEKHKFVEEWRLKTFEKDWPHQYPNKTILANIGFWFRGYGDTVECAFCDCQLSNWCNINNELLEHFNKSLNCPLLRGRPTQNITNNNNLLERHQCEIAKHILQFDFNKFKFVAGSIESNRNKKSDTSIMTELIQISNSFTDNMYTSNTANPHFKHQHWQQLLSSSSSSPLNYIYAYPFFRSRKIREETFKYWPSQCTQKVSLLSQAGFFYTQLNDCVVCHCCGIKIHAFRTNDSPLQIHAWQNVNCQFLKDTFGTIYVQTEVLKLQQKMELPKFKKKENTSFDIICKICMIDDINYALDPCGHIVTCRNCLSKLKKCPICQSKIYDHLKIYFG